MRSFTLIETLAVVVLLGAVMGLAAGSLLGASGAAEARSAVSIVRQADASARMAARGGTPRVLRVTDDSAGLAAFVAGGPAREHPMPGACRVRLVDAAGDAVDGLTFDARGRSEDYAVVLEHGGGVVVVRFAGLTGWSDAGPGGSP